MRSKLRFEILKRDRFTCAYCGRTPPTVLLEVDHLVPRAAGGTDAHENLITSCEDCNAGKGARMLSEGLAAQIGQESAKAIRARLKQAKQAAAVHAEVEAFTYGQLEEIWTAWMKAFGGKIKDGYYTVDYGFPQESRLRDTLKSLPLSEIIQAARITGEKFPYGPKYGGNHFAYFWAIIRRKIEERAS